MAGHLSLVAGDGSRAADRAPAKAGAQSSAQALLTQRSGPLPSQGYWCLPAPPSPTLSELFAATPRDGGWVGFLLAQVEFDKPMLWIQERMAILESGRIHPPGLPSQSLIHVEARDARDALWAMEEGLRCPGLGAVIGELWGDPASLDFTATRRLAVAAERFGVPCWLVRLSGAANLSGARMRWRVASRASLIHPLDPKAPGTPAWDAELFRARGHAPGKWTVSHDQDRFHLAAEIGDRTVAEGDQRAA